MKKAILGVVMFVLLISSVSAVDYLTDEEVSMGPKETKVIQYCVENWNNENSSIDVEVVTVCRDQNTQYGCSGNDTMYPSYFTVTIDSPMNLIGGDGCTDVTLTTNITNPDGNPYKFYYTVGDNMTGAVSQTGTVDAIPEFGVIASAGLLGAAGLYIFKRRKKMNK